MEMQTLQISENRCLPSQNVNYQSRSLITHEYFAKTHLTVSDLTHKSKIAMAIVLANCQLTNGPFDLQCVPYSKEWWDLFKEACESAAGEKYVTDEYDHVPQARSKIHVPVTLEAYNFETCEFLFASYRHTSTGQVGLQVIHSKKQKLLDLPSWEFGVWAFVPTVDPPSEHDKEAIPDFSWDYDPCYTHMLMVIDNPNFKVVDKEVVDLHTKMVNHVRICLGNFVTPDLVTCILQLCDVSGNSELVGSVKTRPTFYNGEWF